SLLTPHGAPALHGPGRSHRHHGVALYPSNITLRAAAMVYIEADIGPTQCAADGRLPVSLAFHLLKSLLQIQCELAVRPSDLPRAVHLGRHNPQIHPA